MTKTLDREVAEMFDGENEGCSRAEVTVSKDAIEKKLYELFGDLAEAKRKDMVISMAMSISLYEESRRLRTYRRFLQVTGASSDWLLDHIHESEVGFRQTMRHEGLEDRLSVSLENTPFAQPRIAA